MRIEPATIAQFQQSANGRWVEVDADVGSVALQVKELADQLGVEFHLRVSEVTGIFKVVQVMPDGEEQLVTSARECDGRLVDRLREVTSPSYDLAADADKLEQDKLRQFEHEQAEKVGDVAERLAHALRTDLNERKIF